MKPVEWYVELRIPGGVRIPKLSFSYDGDGTNDVLLYDQKGNNKWNNPMIIGELSIKVSESYPNVIFENEHEVDLLVISGTYCVCNFHNMKIKSMDFSVVLGSSVYYSK